MNHMKTTLKISGMSCGHCVMSVKNALKNVPGVKTFDVTVGQAVIEAEPNLDVSKVKEAIEEEGYEVVSVG